MTRLSVNVNKIATLRNARGGNVPNLVMVSKDIERFGAEGITIHPRPDERHIKRSDVYELKGEISTEFNIEGYPSRDFIDMVIDVKPHQVTLVPDPPDVLTSDSGWDTIKHQSFLKEIIGEFKTNNIRSSIFIEANKELIENASKTGCDRIELYTEAYARNFTKNPSMAVKEFHDAAIVANNVGLGINAGHDLNLVNLKYFKDNVPNLLEVSIGHALISDALYYGLDNTVKMYLRCLK